MHVALLLAFSLTAAPPSLHEATAALDDLKYELALSTLPAPGLVKEWSRDEVLEYLSTRALAQLGLKQDAEATESFRRLFAIAPEWVLPDQYGPRVRTLVATLRAEAEKRGTLSLKLEAGLLRATKDAFGLGKSLDISWREPGQPVQHASLPFAEQQAPPWPKEKRLDVWGRVVGLEGSTLFAWGSADAPTRLEPLAVSVAGPTVAAGRPLGVPGFIGLGAGAAALVTAGLGLGFAVASQDAERAALAVVRDDNGRITSLTQRDAFALDARVKGNADTATVLFVSAAVLVTAGAGLVLFDRLHAVPAPGGAALMVPLDATFGFAEVRR